MDQVRLIIDAPRDGAQNMAIDEAILTAVGESNAPATLRFYRWSGPTISLGHFQEHAQAAHLSQPFNSLPLVRRITGGGAILHDAELTYSLILPAEHRLARDRSPGALYQAVHGALIAVLKSLGVSASLRGGRAPSSHRGGPFFCFERSNPADVIVNGKKILGSAQRRTLKSLLQHGSLIIANPLGQPGAVSVADFQLADPPDADSLVADCASQLATTLELQLTPGKLNETEIALLDPLKSKYTSDEWTKRR